MQAISQRRPSTSPPFAWPQLPAPRTTIERIDRDVCVAMRDGTRLAADIYIPHTRATRHPVHSGTTYPSHLLLPVVP